MLLSVFFGAGGGQYWDQGCNRGSDRSMEEVTFEKNPNFWQEKIEKNSKILALMCQNYLKLVLFETFSILLRNILIFGLRIIDVLVKKPQIP